MMLVPWLAVPLPLRLTALALLGLLVGSFVNFAAYALDLRPQPISPWSAPANSLPLKRRWYDRLPVIGWLFLRREAEHFGHLHWVRPLLIEMACGVGLPALYWWEAVELGLLPRNLGPATTAIVHAQFLAHALLFTLLLIATITDFVDRIIPDMVTVPGTIAGMLILSLCPSALLLTPNLWPPPVMQRLWAAPIANWNSGLTGLAIALGILALWSFALLHKTCTLRRGWLKGTQYLLISIVRYRSWVVHVPLLLALALYTTWIWTLQGSRWPALFASILGLGIGGFIVWSVRIVGRVSFGMEAMGFGDVTLMAMIGSFLGWQATVITFFLAPLVALVVGSIQWLSSGENRLAFGPYLSLGAMVLVVFWHELWTMRLSRLFESGLIVAAALLSCLPLLGLMMWLLRQLREYRAAAR